MVKLAIIGSGVVGQATGKGFIAKGHDVVFCDINIDTLAELHANQYRTCTPDRLKDEKDVEAFFLTVSTPTVDGKIELNFIRAAVANLGKVLGERSDYPLVVVRSTVPRGTTRDDFIPLLEEYSGKTAGVDFGVCNNPEYLREATSEADFKSPRLITIGALDRRSGKRLKQIYGVHECETALLSLEESEMQKYVHNLFNACKISFFNEMRMLCKTLCPNVDVDEVFRLVSVSAEASWNKDYGILDKGPYGGSCLPKDTTALLTWAKERGVTMPLLRAVIRVNNAVKKEVSNGVD